MDWGSLIGVILGLGGILFGQMLEGGRPGSLLQPAAFMIVALGTLGAVLLQSGAPCFLRGLKMARLVFVRPPDGFDDLANEMCAWSFTARREGLLSLEHRIVHASDPFIAKGLRLLVDGTEPAKLRELLDQEIAAYERRERAAVKIWESAAGYAPTIGILGAVLGLIHVMENLSDPSRLGSGIAVAFVATIYGVGLANLIFLPIANKLRTLVQREVQKRDMLIEAFLGIAAGANPHLIEERMAVYRS
jgi:chemotaxis protein MotA